MQSADPGPGTHLAAIVLTFHFPSCESVCLESVSLTLFPRVFSLPGLSQLERALSLSISL